FGETFLTDADGRVLTTLRYPQRPEPSAGIESASDCQQGPAEGIQLDYRGVKTIHAIRPAPQFSGAACIHAHLAYDEALAPAEALLDQLKIRGATLALFGVAISLILSRWISGPVRRLALSARAMERGDFDQPVPIAGPSEVRALGRGFATMARAIAD